MATISALYPNEPGSHFDGDYYRDRHTPFATRLLTPFGLESVRSLYGVASLDGTPPGFWAISEMVFKSRQAFDDAMAQCGEELFSDIRNYTSVTPLLQESEQVDS
ncbi:MAG: EthD family reductase [Novosphingobium sp.]